MLKEYQALKQQGYYVRVLYSFWSNWGRAIDNKIFRSEEIEKQDFTLVGGMPGDFFFYITRIVFKTGKILINILPDKIKKWFLSRTTIWLFFRSLFYPADLIIAHNLGALPAAAKASIIKNIPFVFDAEDYHRGEHDANSKQSILATLVEDQILPFASLITCASPNISDLHKKNYPQVRNLTINNVFPKKFQLPFAELENEPLRLFWFSQTIGLDRGLNDILQALYKINSDDIQLTLVGYVSDYTKEKIFELTGERYKNITFMSPVPERQLFQIGAVHHVGLALETGTPLNRDICLTNKLFNYVLSGCAIIATDTSSQKRFLKEYPKIGALYSPSNLDQLAAILIYWKNNRHVLTQIRKESWLLGNNLLNWEMEQQALLNAVKEILCKTS